MNNAIESHLRRLQPKAKLKIGTIFAHESYAGLMEGLPHEFYGFQGQNIKTWNYGLRPVPKNAFILNKPFPPMPRVELDLFLSGDKFSSFQLLGNIAHQLNVPHIFQANHLPPLGISKIQSAELKAMKANRHVYVGRASKEAWEDSDPNNPVIYYGLDADIYSGWTGKKKRGITVVNHLFTRGPFCGPELYTEVNNKVPITLVGENPGISATAKSVAHLVEMLCESRFYLNTSIYSCLPMGVCEALMCGVPVISTNHYELPYIIEHGKNGFLTNDPKEMISYANLLIENDDLAAEMSANARKMALETFSQERFLKAWNDVIWGVYNSW